MCGLVGIFAANSQGIVSEQVVRSALEAMKRRGPDGTNFYIDNDLICLGHLRLAIIDLSDRADQPMRLQCKKTRRNLILVFNGEIYNYRELQTRLEHLGHTFRSKSDTEVILHAFEEWGKSCFAEFRGMFAFAIWDEDANQLILARDRFGIKPLYYSQTEDFFVFASELKAFLNFSFVDKKINPQALGMFLRQGWIAQPQTLYQNIFALEPGTVMVITKFQVPSSKFQVRQYTFTNISDSFTQPQEKISLNEAVEKTKSALLDSVQYHLVADVEVGAFLSGGLDSSVIVALMREAQQEKLTTVSAVFPGTDYDESAKAKLVAETFKTNHLEIEITGRDFLDHLESILAAMDQPTVDGVNTYFVSLAAKQAGLKVIVSGLGGDELFYGYPSFQVVPKFMQFLPLLKYRPIRAVVNWITQMNLWDRRLAKLLGMIETSDVLPAAISAYFNYRGLFNNSQVASLIAPELSNLVNAEDIQINQYLPQIEKIQDLSKVISLLEFNFYLKNQLLRDSDVFSMAHSLELRVPFVDNVLLETITKIPENYKIKSGIQKFLLVETVKDLLPPKILQQKKQGFVLPLALWLKGEAKDIVVSELTRSKIYNQKTIFLLLKKFFKGQIHWSRVWSLFVLNRFLRD